MSERLGEPSLQKLSQLRRRLELWDRLKFFECGCERIRQTPDRARPELVVFRLEVEIMHGPREVFGSLQFAFYERFVDHNFGCDICQFESLPGLHLPAHRLEVALHPVDTNGDTVDQRERLRVFGKHRRKRAGYNVSRFGSSEYSISKKPIYGPLGPTSFNFRVARYPTRNCT